MPINGFDGKERRAYFRLNRALPVRLRLTGNNPAKTYTATTRNISQGGVCVEVPQHQKELIEKLSTSGDNSELNLEASIQTNTADIVSKPAWIKCKLDWAMPSATKNPALTMGLTFQKLAEKTRKQILDYLVEEYVDCYGKHNRKKASVG
jgi:c-di-GMP-binding flagellar brake protein YcgR